jgi:hypothetical protein
MRPRHPILLTVLILSLPALAQEPPQPPTSAPPAGSGTSSTAQEQASSATLTSDQIKDLVRRVAEKDLENDKRQRDYTYIQRQEEHKLDGKGQAKSTETKTFEVMMLYEEPVLRLVAKNDQPLSAKDAGKEEEKIQKLINKRKNESDGDRRKRLEKEEKNREEAREFVQEIADAYNFRLVGTEMLEGRDTYVIDADPRPGYQPHRKEAKILPKFRFRVWIDRAETQWVKLDAQCIDTVSFGWFLARLHKGSRLLVETTRINDEVWLPKHVDVKIDVRVALLKNFDADVDVTYRDYKKFRTATKILGVGEVEEQK